MARGKTAKRAPRRGMAKAKRAIAKRAKAKAKKNMDTKFVRIQLSASFIPGQGVTVSNYLYSFLPLFDFKNSTGYGLGNCPEFNLWRAMYDKFRVNTVRWKVTPKANVLDAGQAQNETAYTLTGDGVVHEVVDRDGQGPSNPTQLARYPSYRKHSLLAKWSRSYTVKYPTGVWLDCQNPYDAEMTATFKQLGLGGGLTMYAENMIEEPLEVFNEPWAQVQIEYDVVFQGKTLGDLRSTFDEKGNLVGVTVTPPDQIVNASFTTVAPLYGVENPVRLIEDRTNPDVSYTLSTIVGNIP